MPFPRPAIFHTIDELIDAFPYTERPSTMALFARVQALKGKINRETLIDICYFKTPRSQSLVARNNPAQVRRKFKQLLLIKDDAGRCRKLCELEGVLLPTASTILMFMYPNRYPVIDVRVWKVLKHFRQVTPASFSEAYWAEYLKVMRTLARRHHTTPRHIDKVLYGWHRLQHGINED